MHKYNYTLVVAFEGGSFQQTQVNEDSSWKAIEKFTRESTLNHDEIISITVAETKELPKHVVK